MNADEWGPIADLAGQKWIGLDPDSWFEDIADLDAGYVSLALADATSAPTPASIRRFVNAYVRTAAAAAPLPTGNLSFREWRLRGYPKWDGEKDPAAIWEAAGVNPDLLVPKGDSG